GFLPKAHGSAKSLLPNGKKLPFLPKCSIPEIYLTLSSIWFRMVSPLTLNPQQGDHDGTFNKRKLQE
ncbi:MAG: hypothetical protein VX003_04140, partial [SAR324 cluster bacterium]|nr:hypothetical protein [SAR324 cluster bacterium]